jgi:hypothetical protein
MPTRPDHKHRWKCFRCGARGDVYDLLRLLRGQGVPAASGGHEDHEKLVERLEAEHKKLLVSAGMNSGGAGRRGAGPGLKPPEETRSFTATPRCHAAWSRLSRAEREALRLVCDLGARAGVPLEALAMIARCEVEVEAATVERCRERHRRRHPDLYDWHRLPEAEQQARLDEAARRAQADVRRPARREPPVDLPPGAARVAARAIRGLIGLGAGASAASANERGNSEGG